MELRLIGSQRAHVLAGRLVGHGDRLELLLDDGTWLAGTYEWSGLPARWPGLRVLLGGPWQSIGEVRQPAAVLALHPEARLRWPNATGLRLDE